MNKKPARLSIFIDGGYYNALQRHFNTSFDFNLFVTQIQKRIAEELHENLSLLHIFYYDCLPYFEDNEATNKRRGYFNFLRAQPAVRVREGVLSRSVDSDGNVVYKQKRVDLLLGLDIAEECQKGLVTCLALVSGDGDFVPAVDFMSSRGVQAWLVHGPMSEVTSYSTALWSAADGRIEVDQTFVKIISRGALAM